MLPYAVDVPQDRRAVANWLLIAVTIAASIHGWVAFDENRFGDFILTGWTGRGAFTHMFLHGDPAHLLGNMWFLFVFGNAVCAKLGNLFFLPTYVFMGLFAAAVYLLTGDGTPMLGASGAINGVVGMFLVFYPLNTVSCLWWFFGWPRVTHLSSCWLILLYLAYDIYGVVMRHGGVAYWAHLGGLATGVVLAVALLKLRVVKMERDELSLLQVVGLEPKPEDSLEAGRAGWHRYQQMLAEQTEETAAESSAGIPLSPQEEGAGVAGDGGGRAAGAAATAGGIIRFACDCGKEIKVERRFAGAKGRCPRCKAVVHVPQR